jgi:hypothetical protein
LYANCSDNVFGAVHSLSKSTRLRISFSLLEGRMRGQWESRGARMWLSSRSDVPSTFTHSVCLTLRKPTNWSNHFLQVCNGIFFCFTISSAMYIYANSKISITHCWNQILLQFILVAHWLNIRKCCVSYVFSFGKFKRINVSPLINY